MNANYTYQRAVDDSGDSFTFLYNRPLGRGNKDWFPRNQVVFAPTYDIPFGKGRKYAASLHPVADAIVGGWTLSGATTYYSGRPFTPNIGTYASSALRPNAGPSGRPDLGKNRHRHRRGA